MNDDLLDKVANLSDDKKIELNRYLEYLTKTDLVLLKEVVIDSPPTFYKIKKVKASKEAGEDIYDKYYLTLNLFFNNNISYHVTMKITQDCKKLLRDKIGYLPSLEKMRVEIEIHASKHIDLDGRAAYWRKLVHDVLKCPTDKQLKNSIDRGKEIVTLNAVYDDSTKYGFDRNLDTFQLGGNLLIFRIYGRIKSEQKELDLFFK
jgi:hypothetical protein